MPEKPTRREPEAPLPAPESVRNEDLDHTGGAPGAVPLSSESPPTPGDEKLIYVLREEKKPEVVIKSVRPEVVKPLKVTRGQAPGEPVAW